jgi:hypothetical protein
VSESDKLRKHALECMRLAADCTQLARDVDSPPLQSHFRRIAKVWPTLMDRGPNADPIPKITKRIYPPTAGLRGDTPLPSRSLQLFFRRIAVKTGLCLDCLAQNRLRPRPAESLI